jgi:hypothetical protein
MLSIFETIFEVTESVTKLRNERMTILRLFILQQNKTSLLLNKKTFTDRTKARQKSNICNRDSVFDYLDQCVPNRAPDKFWFV